MAHLTAAQGKVPMAAANAALPTNARVEAANVARPIAAQDKAVARTTAMVAASAAGPMSARVVAANVAAATAALARVLAAKASAVPPMNVLVVAASAVHLTTAADNEPHPSLLASRCPSYRAQRQVYLY